MLQDQDILLRKLSLNDQATLARLANNKKIWSNLRDMMPHPYSEQDALNYINMVQSNDKNAIFAIDYKGEHCGMIGLHPKDDVYKKSAEIGYWIGEPFWGNGIATKAIQLITQYGFEEMKLVRIFAGVFGFNKASMHVLEKNGFIKEGILRKAVFKNNQIWDEHHYGLVK